MLYPALQLSSHQVIRLLCLRDVTTSMAQEGVEDVRDFKWESQLRYYWEHHEAPPSGVKPQVCVRFLEWAWCCASIAGRVMRWVRP